MSPTHEWDADTYHRVADPQFAWGKRLLSTLDLGGDEVVIDAGCGSGRLSRLLLERLPRGRLIAVDVSAEMLNAARRNLQAEFEGRVDYLLTDLLDLNLDSVADLVFSTATFHWILDQPRLFRILTRSLRPHGRLLAQMGGRGNLDRLLSRAEALMAEPAYRPSFQNWVTPWEFPDEVVSRDRLESAGFTAVEVELFEEPTSFPDASAFRQFITTVNLRLHLPRITDPALRKHFVDRLVEAAAEDRPPYTLDYWRLNLKGTRSR